MNFKSIKKALKIIALLVLVSIVGFALFIFRPWSGDPKGWKFAKTRNPEMRTELFSNWQKVSE